jgi:L-fuconolactonase
MTTDDVVVLPPELVDTHVHIASASHSGIESRLAGLVRPWWTEPGRDAASLLSVMDGRGVGRALVAQAVGTYGYDNSYLLHATARYPDRLAAVPAVDLDDRTQDDRELAASIKALAGSAGVVGLRLFAVAPGSSWAKDPARARVAIDAAKEAGVVPVLTLMPAHLQALTALLIERPEVAVALDHCAFPDLSGGRIPEASPLMALREATNVTFKVSSHLLREAAKSGDPADLVAQLADTFGTERLLWGSDYPQTDGDYDALLATARAAARGLTPASRAAFFGGNAARVFFPASPGYGDSGGES